MGQRANSLPGGGEARPFNARMRARRHDGAMSLVAAREFRPQIVLLDIGLPGIRGY
jgi:hypothetical protein